MPRQPVPIQCALVGLAGCVAGWPAQSAEWSAQPSVSWRADHDSNRRLQEEGRADQGVWLSVDLLLKRATETGFIELRSRMEAQRFTQDSALNDEDGALLVSARHLGERTTFDATAQYSRDSTLTTELAETGIIDASTRRDSLSGSLSATRSLSMRQRVQLQLAWFDVEYPAARRLDLVGYRYPSLSTHYAYELSSRTLVGATVFGGELTAPRVGYESRDVGVRLTIEHSFSPVTTFSGSAGVSRTRVGGQENSGYVGAFELSRVTELIRLRLKLDRSAQPSGRGLLVHRDEASLSLTRGLSSRLSITASARAVRNEDTTAFLSVVDRRYYTGELGLAWNASPQLLLSVRAGMSEARHPQTRDSAEGWRTVLGMRWTPVPWTVSR